MSERTISIEKPWDWKKFFFQWEWLMVKKVLVLSVIMAVIGSVAVFANGGQQSGGGGERHAVVFKSTGNPCGERQMSGFEAGIKEQGGTSILRAPDLPTAEAQ